MAQSEMREQYTRSIGCPTDNFVIIICKNKDQKYLSIKGNPPCFYLTHQDEYAQFDFVGTISKRIQQHCDIQIEIKGILRSEHTENYGQSANMRCIYYAEPKVVDKQKQSKTPANYEWIDIPNKQDLDGKIENDLYGWINYLEYENGIIYPMNLFTIEGDQVQFPDYTMSNIKNHNANYQQLMKVKNINNDDNEEQKQQ